MLRQARHKVMQCCIVINPSVQNSFIINLNAMDAFTAFEKDLVALRADLETVRREAE